METLQLLDLFYRVNKKLSKRLFDRFYQREGLSREEAQVIWTIHRKQVCRVSELSGEIGFPSSTVTGILDRLEAKGLLERVHALDDRRSVILKSKPAASAMVERLTTTIDEEMSNILSVIPEGRVQDLTDDLGLILNYLEQEKQ